MGPPGHKRYSFLLPGEANEFVFSLMKLLNCCENQWKSWGSSECSPLYISHLLPGSAGHSFDGTHLTWRFMICSMYLLKSVTGFCWGVLFCSPLFVRYSEITWLLTERDTVSPCLLKLFTVLTAACNSLTFTCQTEFCLQNSWTVFPVCILPPPAIGAAVWVQFLAAFWVKCLPPGVLQNFFPRT